MKNIKTLALTGALGLLVCGIAVAQVHRDDTTHHGLAQHQEDPASAVEHIAQVFPKVAAFDTNKDGKLDAAEQEALAKAISDGTLKLPAHMGQHGGTQLADVPIAHIAEMYAYVARYDVNHDGVLDETEQAAITKAMQNGEFDPHGSNGHEGSSSHQ
jgi:hypothetical protein